MKSHKTVVFHVVEEKSPVNRLKPTAYRPNHACISFKTNLSGFSNFAEGGAYFPLTIDFAWTDALPVIRLMFARQPGGFAMRCFRHWFETR